MLAKDRIWDGQRLPDGAIALVVFVRDIPPFPAPCPAPLLAAAASSGDETRVVLLGPDQLPSFVTAHSTARMICHDAGLWHWSLLASAEASESARSAIWTFSRDARLVDLGWLAHHLNRFEGQWMESWPSLAELLRLYVGEEFLSDDELRTRVIAAASDSTESSLIRILGLIEPVTRGMIQSFRQLVDRAQTIELQEAQDRVRRSRRLATDEEITRSIDDERDYHGRRRGFLGIAVEVRWAIASWSMHRHPIGIDSSEWEPFQAWNQEQFRGAVRILKADSKTKGVFVWPDAQFDAVALIRPQFDSTKRRGWLNRTAEEFRDRHNCPIVWLTGEPSADPAEWDPWIGCDRLLDAWRRLDLAVTASEWGQETGQPHHSTTSHKLLQTRGDLTTWVRTSGFCVFRPRPNYRFLIIQLRHLRIHCLAALCKARGYSHNGRLRSFFLSNSAPSVPIFNDRLEMPAALLRYYARMDSHRASAVGDRRVRSGFSPEEQTATEFENLRDTDPIEHKKWMDVTEGLLTVLPLGLTSSDTNRILGRSFGVDLGGAEIGRLETILAKHVAYELTGFLSDDTLATLSRRLGWKIGDLRGVFIDPVRQVAEFPGTAASHARNVLLERRTTDPVWAQLVEAAKRAGETLADGEEQLAPRLLQERGISLAGRLTDLGYSAQVRRQEIDLTVDEVIKEVSFVLVSHNYQLVDVNCDYLTIEVPEQLARDAQFVELTRERVFAAQQSLLGPVAVVPQATVADAF